MRYGFIVAVALIAATAMAQEDLQTILEREIARTEPDYVVYVPKSVDGSTFDTGNEHFLVFDGPDGSLMAMWTQSSYEGAGDHRIMFARSDDDGKTWSEPLRIVGPSKPEESLQASSLLASVKELNWGGGDQWRLLTRRRVARAP